MRNAVILFLIAGLFSPSTSFAAPNISGVTGTVTNGQSITISGSSFGTKSPAAPLVWDTFESGTVGTAVQSTSATVGTWDSGLGSDNVFYSNATGYGESARAARHPFDSSHWNSSLSKNGTFPVLYIDFKRYYPSSNGNPSNYKPYRMYGNGDTMELYKGYGCGYQVHTVLDGGYNSTDWSGRTISTNTWQHYQLIYKASTPNAADGTIISLIDGATNGHNSTAIKTRSVSAHLDQIRIGHYFDTGSRDGCSPASNSTLYTDNVYIDTTWSRVELCSGSTWERKGNCEIQPPTAWSTTSATVTLNQGAFSGSSTAYLYVVDSAGDANSLGYAVEIGESGGSDTTPPVLSLLAPSGTLAAGTTSTTLSLVTNEAALCRYSTSPGTAYASMTNNFSTALSQSHSATVSGLENGGSYTYYVRCIDGSGIVNTSDATISFSVASIAGTAGALSWEYSTYSADRSDGRIPINIIRTGGSTGTVTAQWSSNGQTATHNVDYYGNDNVTVTFADGVTSVPINTYGSGEDGIEMIANGAADDRYFQMILSNPTGGATLGTTLATVTINGQPVVRGLRISAGAMPVGVGSTKITPIQ